MDIIYTGGKYKVYDTGVTTYNTLPIGTYYIEFNQLEGFSLIPSANVAKAEKVYGRVEEIVDKRLKTELAAGVQLSGQQGSGYSTFPRINGIFYVGIKYSIEKDEPLVKVFLLQFFGEERKIFLKIFTHFSNFDWLFSRKMILFTQG